MGIIERFWSLQRAMVGHDPLQHEANFSVAELANEVEEGPLPLIQFDPPPHLRDDESEVGEAEGISFRSPAYEDYLCSAVIKRAR